MSHPDLTRDLTFEAVMFVDVCHVSPWYTEPLHSAHLFMYVINALPVGLCVCVCVCVCVSF